MAMEDFRVDVIVGKGPGATAIPLEIPPFTVVGATTRAGLLPSPLRDRFGFTAQLDYYAQRRAAPHRRPLGRPARARGHRRRRARDRRPGRAARPASPTGCCAGCATSPRCGPTESSTSPSPRRRPGALRGRRPRPRPARPGRAVGAVRELRRRTGRRRHARRRRGRGARDRRGARRAVPRPPGVPRPHAARPRRHPARLAPPRARRLRPPGSWRSSEPVTSSSPVSLHCSTVALVYERTHRELGPVPASAPRLRRVLAAGAAPGAEPAEGLHGDAERPHARRAGDARQRHLRRAGGGPRRRGRHAGGVRRRRHRGAPGRGEDRPAASTRRPRRSPPTDGVRRPGPPGRVPCLPYPRRRPPASPIKETP